MNSSVIVIYSVIVKLFFPHFNVHLRTKLLLPENSDFIYLNTILSKPLFGHTS